MYIRKSNKQAIWTNSREMRQTHTMSFSKPFYFSFQFIIFFMSCMILLPSFYLHIYFIEGNERFKLGVEDLEKLKFSKFSKFLNFLLF